MQHKLSGNKLGRKSTWRAATVRDLAIATIKQERICTTSARAKEARKLVDELITMGKTGNLADKRRAYAVLLDHGLVSHLFEKTAPRFKNRQGGYTRIIHYKLRKGDNAELVFLELTELEKPIVSGVKAAKAEKPEAQAQASEPAVKAEKAPKAPKAVKSAAKTETKKADAKSEGVAKKVSKKKSEKE